VRVRERVRVRVRGACIGWENTNMCARASCHDISVWLVAKAVEGGIITHDPVNRRGEGR